MSFTSVAVSEVRVQLTRLLLSFSESVSIIWTVKRSLAVRGTPSEFVFSARSLAFVAATFESFDLGSYRIISGNFISFENYIKTSPFFETLTRVSSGKSTLSARELA